MRTTALLPLFAILAAGPAIAGIEAEVQAVTEGREILNEIHTDLDLDGSTEAIVHFADSCGPLGCDWIILTMRDGAAVEIGGGQSKAVSMAPTEPEGTVIEADGVLWAWTEGELYPHYSHLEHEDAREVPASLGDIEALKAHTDWGDTDLDNLRVWVRDVTGDGKRERIIVVNDLDHSIGGMAAPYAILSPTGGEVMAKGFSMDFPRIFTNPEGGARVLEIMPRAITEKQIGG